MSNDLPIEINGAVYALLNAVSVEEWQVYLLSSEVDMESVMNVPSHGLGNAELSECFFRLWRDGFIECLLDSPVDPDIELVKQQFAYTGNQPSCERLLTYRLSSTGGGLWERLASPDWTKFIRSTGPSDREWVLAGVDRSRVELLRRCVRYFPPPVAGTERWRELRPWRATYWKTLPMGHELHFEINYGIARTNDVDLNACRELFETWHSWHKDFNEVVEEYSKNG